MKLLIVAVGRMKAGPERDLLARYVARSTALARSAALVGPVVTELDESRARDPDQRKRDEATAIRSRLPPGATVVTLDERGVSRPSTALATHIGKLRDGAVPCLAFVIGGPDGVDPALRDGTSAMSFGAATFPHQLVRVMLAEQIYRALTILLGHPYHRA